ncbi:ribonuclease III [bacterium]|nr:ribonuclease III [bacterium]
MRSLIYKFYFFRFSKYKSFYKKIYRLLGYFPVNRRLYIQAFIHNSTAETLDGLKTKNSNERLEYLGDAVLGLIIADLLFKKYPFKGEGFLTEMRSKSVSRKKLSEIAFKMGIHQHLSLDESVKSNKAAIRGISGNALEALIGAVYLDRGYKVTKRFIEKKIVLPYLDFEQLKEHTDNFKSILNQWAQKNRKELEFKVVDEKGKNHSKIYTVAAMIDGESAGTAQGPSKKRAEQLASEMACKTLKINYS